MAVRRATMMYPPIEILLEQVDSRFTLVTLAAKRGRQINSYFKGLGEGIGAVVPPQVASVSRKPLSIALEEVAAAKLAYKRVERPDPAQLADGEDLADTADITDELGEERAEAEGTEPGA